MLYAVWVKFSQFLFTHRFISCFFSIFLHYFCCINRKIPLASVQIYTCPFALRGKSRQRHTACELVKFINIQSRFAIFLVCAVCLFFFTFVIPTLVICFWLLVFNIQSYKTRRARTHVPGTTGKTKRPQYTKLKCKIQCNTLRKKRRSLNGNKNANNALSLSSQTMIVHWKCNLPSRGLWQMNAHRRRYW